MKHEAELAGFWYILKPAEVTPSLIYRIKVFISVGSGSLLCRVAAGASLSHVN